jgi:hypothetical protein
MSWLVGTRALRVLSVFWRDEVSGRVEVIERHEKTPEKSKGRWCEARRRRSWCWFERAVQFTHELELVHRHGLVVRQYLAMDRLECARAGRFPCHGRHCACARYQFDLLRISLQVMDSGAPEMLVLCARRSYLTCDYE